MPPTARSRTPWAARRSPSRSHARCSRRPPASAVKIGGMTLGQKLVVVFFAFVALLVGVIWMAFREKRLGREIASDDRAAQQASDGRVLVVIFSSIIGGMLLTFIVAWLVFF